MNFFHLPIYIFFLFTKSFKHSLLVKPPSRKVKRKLKQRHILRIPLFWIHMKLSKIDDTLVGVTLAEKPEHFFSSLSDPSLKILV